MKTIKKITLILLITILCLSLTACSAKEPLTTGDFTKIMENNDFTVVDSTLFVQETVTAKTVLTALSDNYEIDFYELDCVDTAKDFFNLNKEAFLSEDSSEYYAEVNGTNFNYFELTNDTGFRLVSRIENTVLYCYTDTEYEDDILEVVKELGYK